MKKLSAYLFLILFSFQTPSLGSDISDFQIEGISIGDSLLDYFSEEEIKINLRKDYYQHKSNKKFVALEFYQFPFFNTYDGIQFHVKSNDKKYIIYSITGNIFYDENIRSSPFSNIIFMVKHNSFKRTFFKSFFS